MMMTRLVTAVVAVLVLWPAASFAQSCKALNTAQLSQLTAKGITLKLGGEAEGYTGSLKLKKDGTGKGSFVTSAGDKGQISGTWRIADNRFCRIWTDRDEGQELCETWCLTSGNSVEVFVGKRRLGVNSW